MQRTLVVLVLPLMLAACARAGSDSTGTGTVTETTAATVTAPATGAAPTVTPVAETTSSDDRYATVSGRIVNRDTGAPYPRAYVRFGWLENAVTEKETHTVTNAAGRYTIQLPAGQYQVTAGDSCDLNAGFSIAGRAPDDVMITVPGTSVVDFVEYPITPGADLPGVC